jgi:acetyl-CoA C-acetyltransferase
VESDPKRVAVVVGVGEINERPNAEDAGLDPAELMAPALMHADLDAGGGWMARIAPLLVVPQMSFRALDILESVAGLTGLPPHHLKQAPIASGDTPVRLLHDAASRITTGKAEVCAIAGGEALLSAARRAARAGTSSMLFAGSQAAAQPLRQRYGLVTLGVIYPLYENGPRADW